MTLYQNSSINILLRKVYGISFHLIKKECEEECAKQVRPLLITSLEDEIKGIEKGIKDLEAKKAQLQELKKAQAEEDSFKYVNSEK